MDLAIFALHLSGISSLLGAINFGLGLFTLTFIYLFLLWGIRYAIKYREPQCNTYLVRYKYSSYSEPDKPDEAEETDKPDEAEETEEAKEPEEPQEWEKPKQEEKPDETEISGQAEKPEERNLPDRGVYPKNKDWALILGRKGNNIYAHHLAKTQLNSGKPVNINILNEILAYSGLLVNQETLDSLINMPRLIFKNLHEQATKASINEKLGKPHGKIQQRGVYIFYLFR